MTTHPKVKLRRVAERVLHGGRQLKDQSISGGVVDSVIACHARGRGFDSWDLRVDYQNDQLINNNNYQSIDYKSVVR